MKTNELIYNILDIKGVGRVKANTICNSIAQYLSNNTIDKADYIKIGNILSKYLNKTQIDHIFSTDIIIDIKENTPNVFYLNKHQSEFPKYLLEMNTDCPPIISCMGNINLLKKSKIGFCGSRKATNKGLDVTKDISQQVSNRDIVVVSGYASGIDQQAHYWSLKDNGETIIVLPEGIANFKIKKYLKSVWDWSRILVISEFAPNAIWSVNRAMQRNSTIVALSDIMVLIEAKENGGSIDAGYKALKMNRTLFAPVYEGMPIEASGNNLLLTKGALPLRKKKDTGLANLDLIFSSIEQNKIHQHPTSLFDCIDDI